MKKTVLVVAALTMFGVAPAHAATDCNEHYLEFWQKFTEFGNDAKLSGEQVATLNRVALRNYDACQAGDEVGSREFWERFTEIGSDSKALEEFVSKYNPTNDQD